MVEYARRGRRPRAAGDHRRRRRRRPPPGHDRVDDPAAGDRRARCRSSTSTASTRCSRSCRCRPAIPVATVAVGNARNAGLLAVRILGGVRRRAPRTAAALRRYPRGRREGKGRADPRAVRQLTRGRRDSRGTPHPCGPGSTPRAHPTRPRTSWPASGAGRHLPPARRPLQPARPAVRRRRALRSATTSRSAWRTTRATWRCAGPRSARVSTSRRSTTTSTPRRSRTSSTTATPRRSSPRPTSATRWRELVHAAARRGRDRRLVLDGAGAVDGYDAYEDAVARVPGRADRRRARRPRDDVLVGHDRVVPRASGTARTPSARRLALAVRSPASATTYGHRRGLPSTCRPRRCTTPRRCSSASRSHRIGGTCDHPRALRRRGRARRDRASTSVTHSQWVPTMFVRMLKLPEEVRAKYDVSSMQLAIHAAAPCPVEIEAHG